MPEEIFSKKNRTADDGTLCKTLFYDITRQAWVLAAIASVDASNCYDRIALAIASLVFQAFGVPATAIETMLSKIENMNFFLQPGFDNSTSYVEGGVSVKTQGLTQGNGASPAGWAVISICIIGPIERRATVQNSTAQSLAYTTTCQPSCTWTTQIYYISTYPRTKQSTKSTGHYKTACTAGGISS
jgi:hypothetical protein